MLGCRYSQNKTQETVKEKTIARVCQTKSRYVYPAYPSRLLKLS
jgi:hypothetical protein